MCTPIMKECKSTQTITVFKVFVKYVDKDPSKHITPYKKQLTPHDVAEKKPTSHGYCAFFNLKDAKKYARRDEEDHFSVWSYIIPKGLVFRIGTADEMLCIMAPKLKRPKLEYATR